MASRHGSGASAHPGADASSPRPGQLAFWATAAAYTVLLIWQAFALPDAVPGHIGFSGEVTRWGTRTEHLVLGVLVGVLIVAIFALVPRITVKNTALLNLPHKAYWTRPEHWPTAQRMLREDMSRMGALTLAFVGYALWTVGAVSVGDPPAPVLFILVTVLFLAAIIGYSIWMSLGSRWRPPRTERRPRR